MDMVVKAGAGVVALSWYPPGMSDENGESRKKENNIVSKSNFLSVQGPPSDPVVPMLLDAAEKVGVKVIKNKDTPAFFFFNWLEFL